MNNKLKCSVHYNNEGVIGEITFINANGIIHNKNGPTVINYSKNGILFYKSYYINNKLHNVKGPAQIWYSHNNKVCLFKYYLNYDELLNISSNKELKRYIKLQNIK